MRPTVLAKKLNEKRKKIDLIDRKLLDLLNQRLHIALEIGKVKKEMGDKIYDPRREKNILERLRLRLRLRNKGPLKEKDLERIFRPIMSVCRKSQK
jgi:chorismate mutase/prephenate dehydratase